jgi:survival-of-motor-neuron-related-splicing factor 30
MSNNSVEDQLREYETQLADVENLLVESPDDPSLLSLQSDLLELIAITKSSIQPPTAAAASDTFDLALKAAVVQSALDDDENDKPPSAPGASFVDTLEEAATMAYASVATTTAKEVPKKKSKSTVKTEFEVPKHLIPLDTDTEAERNKKRRALKALKSKWRERQKETETTLKQKSWQNFQKKKKLDSKPSIFSTGNSTTVGVVSASTGGRQLTEVGERKRHKHTL